MIKRMSFTTIRVRDQDRALDFYTNALGFEKVSDDAGAMPGFRWLTVRPRGAETQIVLFKVAPDDPVQPGMAGGTVFDTDDMDATFAELKANGVQFTEEPTRQPWGGVQAQFVDPDGNGFVLTQQPGG
jgi:catechol 2,3-dioxygenase-like lactoylglutathione lyase family enzyme